MEALDRYTFEQWQGEHQQFLETKFNLMCNKLDTIKAQRLEDCENCEKHRTECQGHFNEEIQEVKDNSKKTTRLLAAGIVLSVLVCLSIGGNIPFALVWKFILSFV